ncbi:MAG: zinc ribbon domain-containing protein [Thermodesulfobacteriota bacterium]
MPIYEYRCSQCGQVSEILAGIGSHSDLSLCKSCGSSNLEKLMSVSSFVSKDSSRPSGTTCCGREERCDTPPCSGGNRCGRD